MNFCKYKNIFGVPGEGIHKYRFLNMALADILLTLLASIIISYLFKLSFLITTISLFILGIILHRLFCVRTTIDKLLF